LTQEHQERTYQLMQEIMYHIQQERIFQAEFV